jgi:hypothetical protein
MYQGNLLTPLTPYTGFNPLGSDTSWQDVFNNAITTAGQILHPGTPTTIPMYTPGTYATTQIGTSSGPWILGLGLVAILLMRKR